MNLGLKDKIAFVTGASRGIGASVARLLAEEGVDVFVGYHTSSDGAEATAATVRAAGRRAWTVPIDVGDPSSVQTAIHFVTKEANRCDILVLNAGRNVVTPLAALTNAEWDDVIRVNLGGPFYVLNAVRPLLREGASVVMVASVAAHTGAPQHAHYAAAKAGVVNLAKSAARDLAPSVRVNCVAPGLTTTPMGEEAVARQGGSYLKERLLAQRLATPDEIARVVVFLASPAASFVYGATIDVNGGRDLR